MAQGSRVNCISGGTDRCPEVLECLEATDLELGVPGVLDFSKDTLESAPPPLLLDLSDTDGGIGVTRASAGVVVGAGGRRLGRGPLPRPVLRPRPAHGVFTSHHRKVVFLVASYVEPVPVRKSRVENYTTCTWYG